MHRKELFLFGFRIINHADAPALLKSLGDAAPNAGFIARFDLGPVYHEIDIVMDASIERNVVIQRDPFAVGPDPHIPFFQKILKIFLEFPLFVSCEGGHDDNFRFIGIGLDRFDDPLFALRLDRVAAFRAVGSADSGKQNPKVIIDLRHGSDSGAGISSGCFLFDGDRRGYSFGAFDIGFGELSHLPFGKMREGFHIAALPFGIDGVEGKG